MGKFACLVIRSEIHYITFHKWAKCFTSVCWPTTQKWHNFFPKKVCQRGKRLLWDRSHIRSTKIWLIMESRGKNHSREAQSHSPSERHRIPIIPCIFWTLSCENSQARSAAQLLSTAPLFCRLLIINMMLIIRKRLISCIHR